MPVLRNSGRRGPTRHPFLMLVLFKSPPVCCGSSAAGSGNHPAGATCPPMARWRCAGPAASRRAMASQRAIAASCNRAPAQANYSLNTNWSERGGDRRPAPAWSQTRVGRRDHGLQKSHTILQYVRELESGGARVVGASLPRWTPGPRPPPGGWWPAGFAAQMRRHRDAQTELHVSF